MRPVVHVLRVLRCSVRFGIGPGRLGVVVVVGAGIALVALTLAAKVTVPLAVYPFA